MHGLLTALTVFSDINEILICSDQFDAKNIMHACSLKYNRIYNTIIIRGILVCSLYTFDDKLY